MKYSATAARVRFGFTLSVVFACCLLPVAVQAADDYLSELEEEATDTGSHTLATTIANQGTKDRVDAGQDRQVIPGGLDFESFEQELNTNYAGTWFLYVRLSGDQRKAVYRVYQKDSRTTTVREEIVKQMSRG